jgi:hypothetical protein
MVEAAGGGEGSGGDGGEGGGGDGDCSWVAHAKPKEIPGTRSKEPEATGSSGVRQTARPAELLTFYAAVRTPHTISSTASWFFLEHNYQHTPHSHSWNHRKIVYTLASLEIIINPGPPPPPPLRAPWLTLAPSRSLAVRLVAFVVAAQRYAVPVAGDLVLAQIGYCSSIVLWNTKMNAS